MILIRAIELRTQKFSAADGLISELICPLNSIILINSHTNSFGFRGFGVYEPQNPKTPCKFLKFEINEYNLSLALKKTEVV